MSVLVLLQQVAVVLWCLLGGVVLGDQVAGKGSVPPMPDLGQPSGLVRIQ